MTDKKHSGGCMCGAIRYELQTEDTWNVYCHCESCRKHTGAPVTALVTVAAGQVEWTKGERALYESTQGRYRAFCRDCGTSLTWEAEFADTKHPSKSINTGSFMAIHVSTLDHPQEFIPVEHTFLEDALPWFEIKDDLPRYQGSKYIQASK